MQPARSLAGLLSHPNIHVTVIDYTTAIETYNAIETATPSRETQANGHPRQYIPIPYAVPWPVASDTLDARIPVSA